MHSIDQVGTLGSVVLVKHNSRHQDRNNNNNEVPMSVILNAIKGASSAFKIAYFRV